MLSDRPPPSAEHVRRRFSTQKRQGTRPEWTVRRVLHSRGLRYRVGYPVPGMPRRSIDIAFTKARIALFVDGCFWHGCPMHGVSPKSNSDWWRDKLEANRRRDAATDEHLRTVGWTVIRVWEHEVKDPLGEAMQDLSDELVRLVQAE